MNGSLRLSLTGELDLGTSPELEDRLTRLRATKSPVTLDLSRLDFIDSTGLHLLVRMVGDARMKRWQLRIEPDVAPQVMSVFRLVHLDRFLARNDGPPISPGDSPPTRRGRAAPPSPEEPPATV
jgi:anti-anti-sigma factor